MAVAVFLAWRFPDPGAKGGFLHPEIVTKIGIALIFFLHGLSLSFEAFKSGAFRWKLHLVVQTATFLLFPALGELLLLVSGSSVTPDLQLGFFYLCVLPSTVSSSVALTAAARGNVPAAVFNATLSSLIGIFITPLWISWRLKSGGVPMPYGKVILDLVIWLLLPLILGQMGKAFFRRACCPTQERHPHPGSPYHFVARLHLVLRFHKAWRLVNSWMEEPRYYICRIHHNVFPCHAFCQPDLPVTPFFRRGQDCGDLLRFQENPRFRGADGSTDFWEHIGFRTDPAANHDLPSLAAHHLRGSCEQMGSAGL